MESQVQVPASFGVGFLGTAKGIMWPDARNENRHVTVLIDALVHMAAEVQGRIGTPI